MLLVPCEMKMSGSGGQVEFGRGETRTEVFHSRDEDESQRGG